MKRLTVEKSAREMTGTELTHNCVYARDGWARYRDYDKDMDLFDFIREFGDAEKSGELPADNEAAAEMLMDDLQYGIDNSCGRVALVYRIMWAMADLRETLKAYEDTGLTPEEIMDGRMLTGWIPVEERLPEDGAEVLAYIKHNYAEDGWRAYRVYEYTDHWMGIDVYKRQVHICKKGKSGESFFASSWRDFSTKK